MYESKIIKQQQFTHITEPAWVTMDIVQYPSGKYILTYEFTSTIDEPVSTVEEWVYPTEKKAIKAFNREKKALLSNYYTLS